MAIPSFQGFYLPLLRLMSDGKEWTHKDYAPLIIESFDFTDEELREQVSSGANKILDRIGWAQTYLLKAQFIERTNPKYYRITEAGQRFLKTWTKPEVTTKEMMAYSPSLVAFVLGSRKVKRASESSPAQAEKPTKTHRKQAEGSPSTADQEATPRELISTTHKYLNSLLEEEILSRVYKQSWQFFEDVVVDLMLRMGYGGSREQVASALSNGRNRNTGDEGIDGIISEDKLGLDIIYLQAKKWKIDQKIGRPEIQKFSGALMGQKSKKGGLHHNSPVHQGSHSLYDADGGYQDHLDRWQTAGILDARVQRRGLYRGDIPYQEDRQ